MIVAGLLFGLMGVFVKLGAPYFSSAELVFYRSIIGLVVIFGIVRTQGLSLATPHVASHLWRGLSGFLALMLFFYAISALPLATAITLNYTSPLFLALLLTLWLKENPHWRLIGAILLGFLGVILLLRPSLHPEQIKGGLMGLASGFLAGFAYLNVKQLGAMGEPEWRVVFYFTLLATLGGGAWMLVAGFHQPRAEDWPWLMGIGVSATLAQLALTRAYHRGRTLIVGALAYTTVGFSAVYGVLLFGERLPLQAWMGMAVVALAGVWAVRASTPEHVDSL